MNRDAVWEGFTTREKLMIHHALAVLQTHPIKMAADENALARRLTNEAWAAWLRDQKAQIDV